MPFKLSEPVKEIEKDLSNAKQIKLKNNANETSRFDASKPSMSAVPKSKNVQMVDKNILRLPAQISHFVIYQDSLGKVHMAQKRSEEDAIEFKKQLEQGYIGN